MYSNIVKKRITSEDMRSLSQIFCPTKTYFGSEFSGKSTGYKKYLILSGTEVEPSQPLAVTANSKEYPTGYFAEGYINNGQFRCGDEIFADNISKRVFFRKKVYTVNLRNHLNAIYLNKKYDTHTTFEFDSNSVGCSKANGLSNLYCTHFDTYVSQLTDNSESCVVGINISGYIYLKFNAQDEKYFLNGKRIETVQEAKEWISLNSPVMCYERKTPEIIDITDTDIGRMLLNLEPQKEFDWKISGGIGELCVYESIDDALNELRTIILQ